jgi:hypothetical protein
MHIEVRSPSRTNERQSGFPQILQDLRRLTRPKTFEVDVGMTRRCQPPYFRIDETRRHGFGQSNHSYPSSAVFNNTVSSDDIC